MFGMVLVGYLISITVYTIYKLYKNSNLSIQKYVIEVFQNLLYTSIIYCVLNMGFMMLCTLFMTLILDDMNGKIFSQIMAGVLGFYYIPSLIYALSQTKNEKSTKFVKALVIYVALPLVCIGFLIIYAYMIKIFWANEIPSNMIYRILLTLFAISFPVWIMSKNYSEENKITNKITKIMPYAFMPFILLQIYSISARTFENGLTPLRYLSYIVLIFEITATVLSIYKKGDKLKYIFFVFIGLTLFSTATPFNLISVSNANQSYIFRKAMDGKSFNELSDENKEKASGAYKYLANLSNSEKYVNNVSKEDKKELNSYMSITRYGEITKNNVLDIYYHSSVKAIDISEYDILENVSISKYKNDKINLKNMETDGNRKIDIENVINTIIGEYLKNEKDGAKYLQENHILNIKEDTDLFLDNLSLDYNKETKEITWFNLSGKLLIKVL